MQEVYKVLNVSGGDFKTDDGMTLKWGNIEVLGKKILDESSNMVGFPVLKLKFAVSSNKFDAFLNQLKHLISTSDGLLEQKFELDIKKIKDQPVLVVVGFAK